MIDSQLESSCILEVNLAAKGKLSDYCFLRGSMYQMEDVFKHMKFKKGSLNFNRTRDLKYLYTFGIMDCMLKDEEGADMEVSVRGQVGRDTPDRWIGGVLDYAW
ncbi:hypothetical protein FKM82_023952 [Ascaphus truei]